MWLNMQEEKRLKNSSESEETKNQVKPAPTGLVLFMLRNSENKFNI
jgi:plasmid maintenance system antidote protein VapI